MLTEDIDMLIEKPLTKWQVAYLLGLSSNRMHTMMKDGAFTIHLLGDVPFFPSRQFVGVVRAEVVMAVRRIRMSKRLVDESAQS